MLIALGDVIQMRKAHPCGSNSWVIVRTGADVNGTGDGPVAASPCAM